MKRPRFLRLLPGVVIVGASLLALKTTGLVHGAYAQEGFRPPYPSYPFTRDAIESAVATRG